MPPDTLQFTPRPQPQDLKRLEMLTDEQIWGHRLWDNQSAWLLFLEFLSVAEACYRDGRLLDERGCWYPLTFQPNKRLYLRNILFLDKRLFHFAETYPDNRSAWQAWLKWMEEHAAVPPPRDFSYLRERFPSFHEFVSLVGLLQNSIIENGSNKRWSSRFIFPFGSHSIYEDLDHLNWERQYINFGRTGELLYLMLCRSAQHEALKPYLTAVFDTPNKWDVLLQLLQPPEDNRSTRGYSYLPYERHDTFDNLGSDWLTIFQLSLPGFDAFPHLRTLGALHVMLYQLTLAAEWCGKERPALVCEVVAPKKTLVRELSITSYQENNELSARAVDALIKEIQCSPEWQTALAQPGAFTQCRAVLQERVWWPRKDNDYNGPNDPEKLLEELRTEALRRHRQHVGRVHRSYGGDIGLISRRATNTYRYAPTDGLLKTLILANVEQRMELSEFLALLHHRYGLIFGEREAEGSSQVGRFDKKAFEKNAQRLEQRLGSLGMLRRLSDGCAYVENPYARRLV